MYTDVECTEACTLSTVHSLSNIIARSFTVPLLHLGLSKDADFDLLSDAELSEA